MKSASVGGALWLLLQGAPLVVEAMQQQQQRHSSLASQLSHTNVNFHRRIFLIRHGETDWNKQGKLQGGSVDIALNSKGKQQATQLANELHNTGTKFDIIASSHLQRACQTADALIQFSSSTISPSIIGFLYRSNSLIDSGVLSGPFIGNPSCIP